MRAIIYRIAVTSALKGAVLQYESCAASFLVNKMCLNDKLFLVKIIITVRCTHMNRAMVTNFVEFIYTSPLAVDE